MSLFAAIVAQATQPSPQQVVVVKDEEWKFWLMLIICIVSLISPILMPFILGGIRTIKERLNSGDEKFDVHAEKLAKLETTVNTIGENVRSQTVKIDQVRDAETNNRIEENSAVSRLERDIEKNFARKSDLEKLEHKMDAQHGEAMRLLREIRSK